jgi:hypothetical protein
LSPKKFAALIGVVAICVGIVVWYADPVWRVLAITFVALAVWWAGTRFGVESVNAPEQPDAGAALRADLSGLLQELGQDQRNQVLASNDDLDRVKGLLRHAIDDLVRRFGDMNSHIQSQRDLAVSIVSAMSTQEQGTESVSFSEFVLNTSKTMEAFVDNNIKTSKIAMGWSKPWRLSTKTSTRSSPSWVKSNRLPSKPIC